MNEKDDDTLNLWLNTYKEKDIYEIKEFIKELNKGGN